MADAVGLAAELDEPPVVDDAIDQGGGHLVVPEHRPHLLNSRFVVNTTDCLSYASARTWVAEDIAAKGEASPAYAKAKAAMDAGTEFSMKLTDGKTLTYRIIGINHDDPAGGSGKAGLTFLTTTTGIWSPMNAIDTNAGGWEKSELRQKMNSGKIWNLMPSDFQSKVKAVKKLSNNVGGGDENKNAAVTATSDKLFLLSYSEIAPHLLLGILSLDFQRGHPVRGLQGQGDGEPQCQEPRCLLRHRHWSKLVGAYGVYDVSEGPCCGFPPCQKRRRSDTILLRVVRGLRLLCLELLGILSYKPT